MPKGGKLAQGSVVNGQAIGNGPRLQDNYTKEVAAGRMQPINNKLNFFAILLFFCLFLLARLPLWVSIKTILCGQAYSCNLYVFNRPGVAGAVLQSPPSLID